MRVWFFLHTTILAACLPGAVWACDYPASLRMLSATLVSVQDTGGQVATFHRTRLAQALAQTTPALLLRDLQSALGGADLRAATAVLDVSAKLARGTGRGLTASQTDQVRHLAVAIRINCKAQTQVRGPNSLPTASNEQGAPEPGQGLPTLTFLQGLARLSLTFTIYMTFLACVIGIRRQMKTPPRVPRPEDLPPPGGRSFAPPGSADL